MNKKDLKLFRDLLLKEKAKLTKELNNLEHKIDTPSETFAYPYHMADLGTETAEKEEKASNARILPQKSLHGLMGIDINLVSKPLSLSWAIFPGRFAIPAVINANTIIDIAIAPRV